MTGSSGKQHKSSSIITTPTGRTTSPWATHGSLSFATMKTWKQALVKDMARTSIQPVSAHGPYNGLPEYLSQVDHTKKLSIYSLSVHSDPPHSHWPTFLLLALLHFSPYTAFPLSYLHMALSYCPYYPLSPSSSLGSHWPLLAWPIYTIHFITPLPLAHEDAGSMSFQNSCVQLQDQTVPQPRRPPSTAMKTSNLTFTLISLTAHATEFGKKETYSYNIPVIHVIFWYQHSSLWYKHLNTM